MLRVLHVLPHAGGGGERYIDALERIEGVAHRRAGLSDGPALGQALRSMPWRRARVARMARAADLVHAHGDMAAVLGLGVLRGRSSLWTTHGLSYLRRSSGAADAIFRRRLRVAISTTYATICTSECEREELCDLVGPELTSKLRLVHNGIVLPETPTPTARAAVRAELQLGHEDVAVLFVGRLDHHKGTLDALAATERVRAAGKPVVLLMAGDGPLRDVVAARGGSSVRALGFRADVVRLLAGADMFILPSRHEGLSFALLEALGAGVPAVVSDGPGNPEAVGDAGVVVPFGDPHALGDALARLAADPGERSRLGVLGRARIAGPLGERRFLDDVAALYVAAFGRDRVAA